MKPESEYEVDLSDYLFNRARSNYDRPDQIIYLIMDTWREDDHTGMICEEDVLKWYHIEKDRKQDSFSSAMEAIENVWQKLQEKKGTPDRTIQEAIEEDDDRPFITEDEAREKHEELEEAL